MNIWHYLKNTIFLFSPLLFELMTINGFKVCILLPIAYTKFQLRSDWDIRHGLSTDNWLRACYRQKPYDNFFIPTSYSIEHGRLLVGRTELSSPPMLLPRWWSSLIGCPSPFYCHNLRTYLILRYRQHRRLPHNPPAPHFYHLWIWPPLLTLRKFRSAVPGRRSVVSPIANNKTKD